MKINKQILYNIIYNDGHQFSALLLSLVGVGNVGKGKANWLIGDGCVVQTHTLVTVSNMRANANNRLCIPFSFQVCVCKQVCYIVK